MNVMTAQEVCDYLRVSRPTLMKLIATGEVKGKKVGGSWRFRREDIEEVVR